MLYPIQLTVSGVGVVAAPRALPLSGSIGMIVGVADATVAMDAELYLVASTNAPTSVTGGLLIAKMRSVANGTIVIPFVRGLKYSSANLWLVTNFIDAGTGHQVLVYQDQE